MFEREQLPHETDGDSEGLYDRADLFAAYAEETGHFAQFLFKSYFEEIVY